MRLAILDSGHGFGTKRCSRLFTRSRASWCWTSLSWLGILFGGLEYYRDRKAEVAQNSLLNPFGQGCGRTLRGFKNDVPALNVTSDAGEAQRFERRAETFHLDSLPAADIDSSQHGNVGWHELLILLLLLVSVS